MGTLACLLTTIEVARHIEQNILSSTQHTYINTYMYVCIYGIYMNNYFLEL